ncbi:MAG TPA: isopentenyl-diphosphate Delta-isomerase [Puia sp.]|jgi:isopentenyl-diphosphate delta-isomerase|nr:isopentenyl-diphosphate Delta-isomerase [Puia sp.]
MPREEVILVDENDMPLGVMEKIEAHEKALLHRAFSVFIFDRKGRMLLQRRAAGKYHSPGLWTNACCSHPRPGEETEAAAIRRLREELGFTTSLTRLFAFTYRSEYDNGLTEHEFDHVFVGQYNGEIRPDPAEVGDYCYRNMAEIAADMLSDPGRYTSWFHLAFPLVNEKGGGNQF